MQSEGGALYCYDCLNFIMRNSKIQDSLAKSGGAIYLYQTTVTKSQQTDSSKYYYQVIAYLTLYPLDY